jgi:hypothetical protein
MTTEKPTPEPTPEPMPTVLDAQIYGYKGSAHIDWIYPSQYADMAYLYDPENPPQEVESGLVSGMTLSLSIAQAERLRDQLTDFLERQK